jgi:exosortase
MSAKKGCHQRETGYVRTSEWLFIGLLGAVLAPAVLAMSDVWSRLDYYAHGYLVPILALWTAFARRSLLSTLPSERDRRGLLGLAFAFALDLVGTLLSILWLQGLAVILAVASAVLFLRGIAWVRALSFPIGFLIFMVPLPDAWLTPTIDKLQIFVSTTAVWILHSMEMPILREGNIIVLPGGDSLFVAEACSGLTSIINLLCLGAFIAYTQRSLKRRWILVAAAVPIAILANLLRVLGTVLAARAYGVEAATEGSIHDFAGMLVYVFACLALIGIGRLMRSPKPVGATAVGGVRGRVER